MTGPGGGGGESSSSAQKRRRRPEPSPTQRALGLLTRREHSRLELARKLAHRGVETGDAKAAIDKWENEMEAKYKGDEAFMKEVEKEAEKCEGASEGK